LNVSASLPRIQLTFPTFNLQSARGPKNSAASRAGPTQTKPISKQNKFEVPQNQLLVGDIFKRKLESENSGIKNFVQIGSSSDDDAPFCAPPCVVGNPAPVTSHKPTRLAPLSSIIPENPYTEPVLTWLRKHAPNVESCEGFKIDRKATCVPSPNGSTMVLLILGSFGVRDHEGCCTTRMILKIFQSLAACCGLKMPSLLYVDLAAVQTRLAKMFKDAGGSKLYNYPNVNDPLFPPVPRASQAYSDLVVEACEKAGYTVHRYVLSAKVHECYELTGCANKDVLFSPVHPSGIMGEPAKFQAFKGQSEILWATIAISEGRCANMEEALNLFQERLGWNKLEMQTWLKSIGIDWTKLAIKCFVHLPLELAQGVWDRVVDRYDGDVVRARSLFKSRVWYWDDLRHCEEHGMLKCMCTECRPDKLCNHPKCEQNACYSSAGTKSATKCRHHREPGMVNVVYKLCDHPQCDKVPSFNFPGVLPATKCGGHRDAKMVDVRSAKCIEPGCVKRPYFNFPDKKPATKCDEHKDDGMIRVKKH